MAQMLAMVVNERQDDCDLHLPHVEFPYNNAVSAATGIAPNEVHMDRLPRNPLTVFDRNGVVGHKSLARDHLAYCDLASGKSARMTLFAHTTQSPFPVLTAETPPSPTRCVQHLNSLWVVEHGYTILHLPSARV